MTGYTVHTGTTLKFSASWDRIFERPPQAADAKVSKSQKTAAAKTKKRTASATKSRAAKRAKSRTK